MQISRTLLLTLISMMSYHIGAMDFQPKRPGLTQWPAYIYYEAFPSAIANPARMLEELPHMQTRACMLPQTAALALDESTRVCLDWAYALCQIEKTGLLLKPIETYSIEDISLISSWLTRFTAKNPGSFRTREARWDLKASYTTEEKKRIQAIFSKSPDAVTAEEDSFIRSCFLHFIPPQNIQQNLSSFLENLKAIEAGFQADTQATTAQKIAAYLDIAAYIHLTIVGTHAYEEGSKRLGRILMFIYLAQRGIEPLTFYHCHDYIYKLEVTLSGQDRNAFKKYVRDTYITNQKLRPNPNFFKILQDVAAAGTPPEKTHETLLNHPLQKKWQAAQAVVREKTELAEASSKKEIDSQQKSCPICKKIFDELNRPKQCSGCKAISYCSVDCQKKDWPTHKSACKK